jgi:hypothetical protein
MDATVERPRLVPKDRDEAVRKAKDLAMREAEQAATVLSIRASIRDMLGLPIVSLRREDLRQGGRALTETQRVLGLALSSDAMLQHLVRFRASRGTVTVSGYDVFAAMLLDSASSGMNRVQAMRLIVDMIEPITRTVDVPAGGVSFVFADSHREEAAEAV